MSLINHFCTNCGSPLKEGVRFCSNCGQKIMTEQPVKSVAPETEETVKEDVVPETTAVLPEIDETSNNEAPIADEIIDEPADEEIEALPEVNQCEEVNEKIPEPEEKKAPKKHTGLKIVVSIVAAALIVVVSVLATLAVLDLNGYLNKESSHSSSEIQDPSTSTTIGGKEIKYGDYVTINIEGDAGNTAPMVFAKCEQSVVGIRVVREVSSTPWSSSTIQTQGEGSGVIYREDGYIITNHHVIESTLDENGKMKSGYYVQVFLDKSLTSYCEATIIGFDSTTDLALIKIDVTGLTPIEFADIDKVGTGDTVYTIGSPGGLEFMNSICDGIISGINRNITTDTGLVYDLIQTTAAINPGNSGGALLNNRGQLVGICALKIASSQYDDMCFAISGNTVKAVMQDILENGKVVRPQLGVMINTTYDAQAAESSGLPVGAWIESVTENGPAAKAGMQASTIITAIDGVQIKDFASLRTELLKHKVGDKIVVTVYEYSKKSTRELGEYKDYNVTLEAQE